MLTSEEQEESVVIKMKEVASEVEALKEQISALTEHKFAEAHCYIA